MISSQLHRAGHPSRININAASPEGQQSGLLIDSIVMTDNIVTVVDAAINRVIGSFPMNIVEVALRHTLGL